MTLIDKFELKLAANNLRAIRHPLRLKLLDFVNNNQPVHVTKIYKQLQLEQSVASSHLAILRDSGFFSTKREGKKIFYSINFKKIERVINAIKKHANHKK